MIGWLMALPWVSRLGMYVAAAGAFFATLAALRRSDESPRPLSGTARIGEGGV